MYEENSAIFIFLVIAMIGQSFFVGLFAVAAVAMLCGYAERKGKGDHLPRKGGEKRRRRGVWLDAGKGHTQQLNFSPPPL